jgi:hypothetical protein
VFTPRSYSLRVINIVTARYLSTPRAGLMADLRNAPF